MGIEEILSPEDEVAVLVSNDSKSKSSPYLQFPDDYRVAEVMTPPNIAGKAYGEINFRDKYKLSLITLKRDFVEYVKDNQQTIQHIIGVPDSKTIIQADDSLVLFGKNRDLERFIEINS